MFFGCSCFVARVAGLRRSSRQRVVGSSSSRASQRCTVRFMRARSLHYARGCSSVQQYSALVRPPQAQATTVSAVCQAGFALFRHCGLTIRSSGLPMSVCAKIVRRRRQPLNSSVRPHRAFRFSARVSRRHGLASSPRLSFVHRLAGLRVGCPRGSRAKHLAQVQSVVALRLARGSLIPAQATTAWRCCYALVVALSFSPAAACICGLTIR